MAAKRNGTTTGVSRVWAAKLVGEPRRSLSAVQFRWEASRRGLAYIRVQLVTRVGPIHRVMSAKALGISAPEGTGRVPLDLRRVPAGPVEVNLTPISDDGRPGTSSTTNFVVAGVATTEEDGVVLVPLSRRIARPGRREVAFFRSEVRLEAGAAALLLTVKGPDGVEDVIDLAPPVGVEPLVLFAFGPNHLPGTYQVILTRGSRFG